MQARSKSCPPTIPRPFACACGRTATPTFAQWFYFRVSGARGEPLTMTFENAADCAFADGWRDYQAVASYDRDQLVPRADSLRRPRADHRAHAGFRRRLLRVFRAV